MATTAQSAARTLSTTAPPAELRPSPCVLDRAGSSSAPVSPATPPWTPPRRRRIASAESSSTTSWLDVQLVVDVVKDADGCREVHCYLHFWDQTAHCAIPLRRLLFWLLFCFLLLPTGAFRMMPRVPGMAFHAPTVGPSALNVPSRIGRLDNLTTLDQVSLSAAAGETAASYLGITEVSVPGLEPLLEDFDQCILDASSDDDFSACLQQVHSSTVDELSGVIVKEGCELLSSADDGTAVGLLGHFLHTVKSEGIEAIEAATLRRMALRACVSASLHKVTVCVLPAVSACMLHAPDALHAVTSLVS